MLTERERERRCCLSSFLLPQVLIIEIKSFDEVITIGHKKYREHNLPWYRVLNW